MPLTTQPPFQPRIFGANLVPQLRVDFLMLVFDTALETQQSSTKDPSLRKPSAILIRCAPSGIYFSRIRVRGKLIRQSLKTNKLTLAKLRLADLDKVERQRAEVQGAIANGNMRCGEQR